MSLFVVECRDIFFPVPFDVVSWQHLGFRSALRDVKLWLQTRGRDEDAG